jgi:hypothetical protein
MPIVTILGGAAAGSEALVPLGRDGVLAGAQALMTMSIATTPNQTALHRIGVRIKRPPAYSITSTNAI